jgi:hypothetical protein
LIDPYEDASKGIFRRPNKRRLQCDMSPNNTGTDDKSMRRKLFQTMIVQTMQYPY